MDIDFVFPFGNLDMFLVNLIPSLSLILFNILIIFALKKKKNEYSSSNLLFKSSLITLFFLIGFIFFLPGFVATDISEEEVIILANITTLLHTIYYVPIIITQGIVFSIFGSRNKDQYKSYLMMTGILLLVYYMWGYINFLLINYSVFNYTNPFNILFLLVMRYIFLGVILAAYCFLIIHGILYNDLIINLTGIILIALHLLLFFLGPYLIQLLY